MPRIFQFTPLREGRLLTVDGWASDIRISIHAPAGGATSAYFAGRLPLSAYFNSRPCGRGDYPGTASPVPPNRFQFTPLREGRRACWYVELLADTLFQFTPLREGRRRYGHFDLDVIFYFNSRPCGRGDMSGRTICWPRSISIHAPAGGATSSRVN